MESEQANTPHVDVVAKLRRKSQAYVAVFGTESERTSDQKIVWDDLMERGGVNSPVFQINREGEFNALRAAHLDGARTLCLVIQDFIKRAIANTESDKPKTKR